MPTEGTQQTIQLPLPRIVKCATTGCPGWITLDITRHQTDPCRYCRVGVDTLRFLLSRIGSENKALPQEVHEEFNRLMLTMAGAWGQNVYLRPSNDTLVDLKAGVRGVIVEYNPLLGDAGEDGPGPLVGIILHKLLHFEAHLGQRPPQLAVKAGSRDHEGMLPLMSYLMTVADHVWVTARLKSLNSQLYEAQRKWGLDLAQMLVGSESMFNRYLSERTHNKLLATLGERGDASEFLKAVLGRLAALTAQILEREKEETRRVYIAVQIANIRLLNEDAYAPYTAMLTDLSLPNVKEAMQLADRLYSDLVASALGSVPAIKRDENVAVSMDPGVFIRGLEGAVKALGMANHFELKA
ncbi:MAG: hypothetical protein M3014_00220 [Chloroflexota bacterium]|nr:hypothetical protein [Chloroflexota bacterium]